jgi:hypothetical protein
MTLDKKYVLEEGPRPISDDMYCAQVEARYRQLLESHPTEGHVQKFLERHPALVPGGRTPSSNSGHAPLHSMLISQPQLPGLSARFPDFMWIAAHSQTWYPTLIEIERPDKKIFRSDLVPTAQFTQALNQLAQWRVWFSQPENVLKFIREYGVPEDVWSYRSMKLHMILIYGRRSEFEGNLEMSKHRSALLSGDDEELMSFDRLRLEKVFGDVISVRAHGSGRFEALYIQPTFSFSPLSAERLLRIDKLEHAIRNAEVAEERVEFLLRRLPYWRHWSTQQQVGVIDLGDRE